MFNFFKKPPAARPLLLAARPIQNQLVQLSTPAPGKTRLSAPIQSTPLKRLFGTRARQKSFELDDLGLFVWHACDGKSTIEQIILSFSHTHRTNLREAEISVTTFLKTLLQRNLIALLTHPPKKPRPRRKTK